MKNLKNYIIAASNEFNLDIDDFYLGIMREVHFPVVEQTMNLLLTVQELSDFNRNEEEE